MPSDKFKSQEVLGITDFLQSQPTPDLALSLAHIISNNAIKCYGLSDAIDVILLHSSSVHSILNRKVVTKNILFKYLHDKRISVTTSFTKQLLVEKLIEYWNESGRTTAEPLEYSQQSEEEPASHPIVTEDRLNPTASNQQQFPIQQMSRTFANWFFGNLNNSIIGASDFWSNVQCETGFYQNKKHIQNEQMMGADQTTTFLLSLISTHQLYFNLNDCSDGVQGRIDPHGLVLVLSCGTLHKMQEFVGTFESVFGLLRDPFAENNWKIKHLNLRLYNSTTNASMRPALRDCESMGALLCLDAGPVVEEPE